MSEETAGYETEADTTEYSGKHLTVKIAVELIIVHFAGRSDIKKADIMCVVEDIHKKNGGLPQNSYDSYSALIGHALYVLKHVEFADNKRKGYWSFVGLDDISNWLAELR